MPGPPILRAIQPREAEPARQSRRADRGEGNSCPHGEAPQRAGANQGTGQGNRATGGNSGLAGGLSSLQLYTWEDIKRLRLSLATVRPCAVLRRLSQAAFWMQKSVLPSDFRQPIPCLSLLSGRECLPLLAVVVARAPARSTRETC